MSALKEFNDAFSQFACCKSRRHQAVRPRNVEQQSSAEKCDMAPIWTRPESMPLSRPDSSVSDSVAAGSEYYKLYRNRTEYTWKIQSDSQLSMNSVPYIEILASQEIEQAQATEQFGQKKNCKSTDYASGKETERVLSSPNMWKILHLRTTESAFEHVPSSPMGSIRLII